MVKHFMHFKMEGIYIFSLVGTNTTTLLQEGTNCLFFPLLSELTLISGRLANLFFL